MKKLYTLMFLFVAFIFSYGQWGISPKGKSGSSDEYFKLDITHLKKQLRGAQESGVNSKPVEVSIPVLGEGIQVFEVYSLPVMAKELVEQYDLGSYVGVAKNDKSKYIRFSLAPNDFQSMMIVRGKYQFIDPSDKSNSIYRVHYKTKKTKDQPFVCSTDESEQHKKEMDNLFNNGNHFSNQPSNFAKSSDQKYRTMRMAISVTGEYTQYHGGTVAGALTAINATMTRVNGIFEKDFALHLNVQNYPGVIYTNPAIDPYSPAAGGGMNNWNVQLQQTLTANVGNANYDIGHLFGGSGGGGNAGCIGCFCVNPSGAGDTQKGSAYTSPANGQPEGDLFDIDYVAHEIGHQLGANHTFSHSLEGAGVNMEPGSGSSIMGYAGITGGAFTDVQANSDPYFHVASLDQVQTKLGERTCDVEIDIANTPPTIPSLPTYTIPKGTAFVLTADVADTENDPLTYTWEEIDNATQTINRDNLGTTTTGASFRSVEPTATGNTRYFPAFPTVLAGVLDNSNQNWESVSMVARQSRFALVVRDNHNIATQQQTQYGIQVINVGNDGPFQVLSTTAYNNSSAAFNWDVANTNVAPYNVSNVKIDYSTDNGTSWTTILESTPNDGTEDLQFSPVATGTTIIVRVSAIDNVFYALKNVTVEQTTPCSSNPTAGVAVNSIAVTTANVTWDALSDGSYVFRYRKVGDPNWITSPLNTNTYSLTGLEEQTTYEVQVANVCSGVTGSFSNSVNFTTLSLTYCDVASTNSSQYWISNVTVSSNDNPTMSSVSTGNNYIDYTADASRLVKLTIGSAGNTISVTKSTINPNPNNFAVAAWIDFNRNGVFEDTEKILDVAPTSVNTPFTANFDVPADAYNGSEKTRMRVILRFSQNPEPCTSFTYGEIEDYAVELIGTGITCPTEIPTGLTISNITLNSADATWTPIAGTTSVIRYREVGTTAWTETQVSNNTNPMTGLNPGTEYEVQVATYCNDTTGTFSSSVNFTTLSCPTEIPTGLTISNITLNSADATWTPIAGTTSVIRYREVGTTAWIETQMSNNTNPMTGLNPGAEYEVQVATYCNDTTGTFSSSVNFTTLSCPTEIPTGLAISNVTASSAEATWTPVAGTTSMIRYRAVGTAAWTEVAVADVTHTISGLSAGVEYEVQVANVCAGTTAGYSSSVNFTTPTLQWCDVTTTNDTDEWIGNVTVTPVGNAQMSNDSGASNYTNYSSNPATLINLTLGSTGNEISVGKAWSGTNYNENVTVWIDFNRDGVFADSEKIMESPGSNDTPVTASFDVPLSAYNGTETTRMRVMLKYGTTLPSGACTGYTYGEIEDYAVKFGQPDPCTLAAPTGLTINNITASTAQAVWAPYSGSVYHIRYREVGTAAWTTVNDLNLNVYQMTGLTEATTYEVQVANTCNGVMGDFGTSVQFTTPTLEWCDATTTNTTSSWISNVSVNPTESPAEPMSNDSASSTYTDYTENSDALVTLVVGSTGNEISVSKAWGGTQWSLNTNVWIDFNRDGVFAPSEKVLNSSSSTDTPITGLFDVPADAYSGPLTTRMRVMVKEFSNHPEPCDSYAWGEVEDYAVRIRPPVPCDLDAPQNLTVLNITDTSAQVSWDQDPGGATYKFRYKEMSATNWTEVSLTANTFSLTGLTPLTEYQIEVVPVCDNNDGTVAETTFETKCNPTPPNGLTVTDITSTSALVSWNNVSNIGNAVYKVLYREIGAANWTEVDVNAPTNTHTITGLNPYTNYEVKVATECSGAINPYTTAEVFTTLPTCEMAPTGLTVTNISTTQAQVDWDAYDSNTYVLRWRELGPNPWNTVELTTNAYIIQGLEEQTQYEVQIAKVCNGATQTFTQPYVFTTPSIIYCNASGAASSTEYISNVTVNYDPQFIITNPLTGEPILDPSTGEPTLEMSNDSEASPYTSYVSNPETIITLVQGSQNNKLSVKKSWNGSQKDEGVAAWIDFNRDGIFTDNEMILKSEPSTETPVEATFSVPADAYVSLTTNKFVVMRVAVTRDGLPTACGTSRYGEVEDYKVMISKNLSFSIVPTDQIAIYPNPATDVINMTNVKDGDKFEIYTAGGRIAKQGKIAGAKVNISNLVSGVYIIVIKTKDEEAQIKFIKE